MRQNLKTVIAGVLLAGFLALAFPSTAHADNPGDPCTNADPSPAVQLGDARLMVCDGTIWKSVTDIATDGQSLFQVDNDTGSCTATKLGRIKYDGGSTWQYCNGTSWTALGGGGSSLWTAGAGDDIYYNSGTTYSVGIGLTDPLATLHVQSATTAELRVENTGDSNSVFALGGNRSSADTDVGEFHFRWNGNTVARIKGKAGTDTTNKDEGWLDFQTRNDGDGSTVSRMVISKAGKVGIGTVSPTDRLHLAESDTNGPTLTLENTHSTANASALAFTARGSAKWYITTDWDEDGGQDFQIVDGPSGDKRRLVIDGAGNVGIGTTSPGTKLTVSTASDSYGVMHTDGTRSIGTWLDSDGGWFGTESNHDLHFFTNDGAPQMTMKTSGNVGIGTTSPSADTLLHVYNSSSSVNDGLASVEIEGHQDGQAQLQLVTLGDGTKSVEGGFASVKGWLVQGFGNNYQGDAAWRNDFALDYWDGGSWYEPFRIDSVTKNVGLSITTPSERLHVNGRIRFDTLGTSTSTTVCRNTTAGNVLAACTSSIRFKEDVKDLGFGLEEVLKMRPVNFKWKDREERDFGFIAEEMESINPLFATYDKDGVIEGVKYNQLTAVLVNAVKELKTENDDLRQRLEALESRLGGQGQ